MISNIAVNNLHQNTAIPKILSVIYLQKRKKGKKLRKKRGDGDVASLLGVQIPPPTP
jgi:hypothetical protein